MYWIDGSNNENGSLLEGDAFCLSNVQWIELQLKRAFPRAKIYVQDTRGDDQHLAVSISAPEFFGKTMVACHKLVYGALHEMRQGKIHALALKTQALDPKEL